jgi:hypothetical protein
MTRRPPTTLIVDPSAGGVNLRLSEFMGDVEREDAPERLLRLARELQDRLSERQKREKPN